MFSILGRPKLPEDDMKKTETGGNISGLYVEVYVLLLAHLLVLSNAESNSKMFA